MWVFCGGMQRSGSTLQFQITAELVESSGRGERHEYVERDRLPSILKQDADFSRYKVVKTHAFSAAIGAEFQANRALGVYIYRDIRDVVVSIIHKEGKAFDPVWVNRRIDNNLAWFEEWARQPRMLVSRYEQVITDLPAEVARVAAHLGIDTTPADCARIAEMFSIEEQRRTIEKSITQNNLRVGPGGAVFDQHSLLHTNHIHSGEVGGWKNQLTADQIEVIEARAGRWLTENGYTLHSS